MKIGRLLWAAHIVQFGSSKSCHTGDRTPDNRRLPARLQPAVGYVAVAVTVVTLSDRPVPPFARASARKRADIGDGTDDRTSTQRGIGSVAGPPAPVPSAALRAARLQIVGSGQGSVSAREYLAELPALAEEIAAGTFDVDARAMPLADVEQAWAAAADARKRIVLTPQP